MSSGLSADRVRTLEAFVRIYGHLVLDAIEAYAGGGEPTVLLAQAPAADWFAERGPDALPPDMEVRRLDQARLLSALDPEAPSVRLLMRQFHSLDPSQEAVLGLQFARDEVISHVVRVARRRRAPLGELSASEVNQR